MEIKGKNPYRAFARKFHTVREADVLEQYLRGPDGVTAAKVYERTADAVIYYKEGSGRRYSYGSGVLMVRITENRRWQLKAGTRHNRVQRKADSGR